MRPEALVTAVFGTLSVFGWAASCVRQGTSADPAPTITITAEPPQPAAQDAGVCPTVCERAQTACRTHAPKPVADCVTKCQDDARVLVAPSLFCLAVTHTCDEDCP